MNTKLCWKRGVFVVVAQVVFLFICLVDPSVGQNLAQNQSSQCLDVMSETGNCSQHSEKWTFDRHSNNNNDSNNIEGACVKFVYGGCGASENFFDTELECQQVCLSLVPTPNLEAHPQTVTPMTTTMTGTDNPLASNSPKNWTGTPTHSEATTSSSTTIRFSRNDEGETKEATLSTSLTPSNGNTNSRAPNQPELMGPTSTTSHNDLSQSFTQDRMTNGSTNPTDSDHDQVPTTITKAQTSNEINLEGKSTEASYLMESTTNTSQDVKENHANLIASTVDSLVMENDSTKTASDEIQVEKQPGTLTRSERESTLQEPLNGTISVTTDGLVTTEQQMDPEPQTTFSRKSNERQPEPREETTRDWQRHHSDFENELPSLDLSESQCSGLSTFVAKMFYPLCRRESSVWTFEDGRCMFDRLGGCKFTLNIFQTRQLCEEACVNRTAETAPNSDEKTESNNNRKDVDEDIQDQGGWGHALVHKYHAHRDTDANEVTEPKTNIHVSMTGNTESDLKENEGMARHGNTDRNDNRNFQEYQRYHYMNTGDKDPRNMGAQGLQNFPASQNSIASHSRPLAWSFKSNTEETYPMHDGPDKWPQSYFKYQTDLSKDQRSSFRSDNFEGGDKKDQMNERENSKDMYAGIDSWPPPPPSENINTEDKEKARQRDNLNEKHFDSRTIASSKRQDMDAMNDNPLYNNQFEGPPTFGRTNSYGQNNVRDEMEPQGNDVTQEGKFIKQFTPYKEFERQYERFDNNEQKQLLSQYGQIGHKQQTIQSKDRELADKPQSRLESASQMKYSQPINNKEPIGTSESYQISHDFQVDHTHSDARSYHQQGQPRYSLGDHDQKQYGSREKTGDSGEKYNDGSKSRDSSHEENHALPTDPRPIKRSEVCSEPWSETGLCRGHIQSWTFVNGQCVEFIYGGCGATKNFFQTQLACEAACQQQHD